MANPNIIEDTGERLLYDRYGKNELHETFWAHMGRYIYAYTLAGSLGRRLKILDAASGSGYGTYLLSRGGHDCLGVDYDALAVKYSNNIFGSGDCRYVQGDVVTLPFEDSTFDLVVSFETIEHLFKEQQEQFIVEITRVLRPGGYLILSAPVQSHGLEQPEHNHFHHYEPTPEELIALVGSHFKVKKTMGQIILGPIPSDISPSGEIMAPSRGVNNNQVLRRVRQLVRSLANFLFEKKYLEHPLLLKRIMELLYPGHLLKEIDLTAWRVSCAVVVAEL